MDKIDKHYISDIDKKLAEFDRTHPKSPAQQAEYDKYQVIYHKRDIQTDEEIEKEDIWD